AELFIDRSDSLAKTARRRPDLRGLSLFLSRAARPDALIVALARSRSGAPAGPLPCLGSRRGVLIRDDAAAVQSPEGRRDLYALRAGCERGVGAREADVERDLIVASPLGGEGRQRA